MKTIYKTARVTTVEAKREVAKKPRAPKKPQFYILGTGPMTLVETDAIPQELARKLKIAFELLTS